MSSVPITAIMSATRWPRTSSGSACRLMKQAGPNAQPVRVGAAVGHRVEAELALRTLDREVDLALGRLDHLRDLGHHRPVGQLRQALLDDAHRLPHLLHAHQVAVVGVAVGADRDLEVHLVVAVVGEHLADVPLDAGAPQGRAGQPPLHGVRRGDHADADGAQLPDPVVGEQALPLGDPRRQLVHECAAAVGPTLGQVERLPAHPHAVEGEAGTAVLLVEVEDRSPAPGRCRRTASARRCRARGCPAR